MYPHHRETIEKIRDAFAVQDDILAVLLGGSVAHGFCTDTSDVDIMLIVSEDEYVKRRDADQLLYWDNALSTYEGGYVDGKYVSLDFLKKVRERGSEPARFAFQDARIILSRIEGLRELLADIPRYPVEGKEMRLARFYAQLEAWKWYFAEAMRHDIGYLRHMAVAKLILFGGRLILTHNEMLYPYHKWFLRVLSDAADKPVGLMGQIDNLLKDASMENVEAFYHSIDDFRQWVDDDISFGQSWGQFFMCDSELNWLTGHTPVDDL